MLKIQETLTEKNDNTLITEANEFTHQEQTLSYQLFDKVHFEKVTELDYLDFKEKFTDDNKPYDFACLKGFD